MWSRIASLSLMVCTAAGCYQPYQLTQDRAVGLWRNMKQQTTQPRPSVSSSPRMLDLKQALARALRDNPDLKRLRLRIPVRKAQIDEAAQILNPSFRISELRLDQILDNEPEVETSLRFRMERPGALSARRHMARMDLTGLRTRISRRVQAVRGQVRLCFLRLAILTEDLRQVTEEIALRTRHQALVQERVKEGVATSVDVALVNVPLVRSIDEKRRVEVQHADAMEALRALIGATPRERFVVKTSLAHFGTPPSHAQLDILVMSALKRRPELQGAASQIAKAHAALHLAQIKRIPWFRFAQINYEFSSPLKPTRFGFAVSLELPVFSLNNGEIAVREASLRRRQTEEKLLVSTIEREVHRRAQHVKNCWKRLEHIRKQLLPAVISATQAIEAAVKAGTVNAVKAVIVAEKRVRAQRSYLAALHRYHQAVIKLDNAVGN